MNNELISAQYNKWCNQLAESTSYKILKKMDNKQIEDAFYKELTFGTGGIRGKMGLGTAKINEFVVARVTQGLANYINKRYNRFPCKKVVIGYDTRKNSSFFAKVVTIVLEHNGISTLLFKEALPTPCVSFAVRELDCLFGIVITASHNPSEYNGYKVYEKNGCQITNEMADAIFSEIKKLDYFGHSFNLDNHDFNYVPDNVYNSYINSVLEQSILVNSKVNEDLRIVFTPLNGTGLKPVTDVLHRAGFHNIILVEEQKMPDGDFPTCKKPNPEEESAMKLGIEYAIKHNSDIVLATDPDCDRISIAIKFNEDYRILNANELGCLLLDFICQNIILDKDSVFIKTIVTTDLSETIARSYGVKTINTLTGFKYIGEQIGFLEKNKRVEDFIFGFEESCGFLRGSYVRDKDATVAALLICEMYSYYQNQGEGIIERLNYLYDKFGYCLNVQDSFEFEGLEGSILMDKIMDYIRYKLQNIGKKNIVLKKDYLNGIDDLPKSNVIKVFLDNNSSIIFRPSGTEPKMKVYYSVFSESHDKAKEVYLSLKRSIKDTIFSITLD